MVSHMAGEIKMENVCREEWKELALMENNIFLSHI